MSKRIELKPIKPAINTPDWIRSFKGYENYTDERANELINSLKTLAEILFQMTRKNSYYADYKVVSYLHDDIEPLKRAA